MALLSRLIHCSLTAGLLLVSGASYAESGRADYDLDDDGLIEINDLADLDEIRNNLDGSSLYGESTGCPAEGCNGFELTADLDFDTNQNGVIDEGDDYWNGGEGWLPIGDRNNRVRADFKGNGFSIRGLMINRPNDIYQGLFGRTYNNRISGLHLNYVSISANSIVGALVGYAEATSISQVAVVGRIQGNEFVGGIVGYVGHDSVCSGCAVSGRVEATHYAGGIVGNGSGDITIDNSLSLTRVVSGMDSSIYQAGVAAYHPEQITNTLVIGFQEHSGAVFSGRFGTASQSYWAVDVTGKTNAGVSSSTDLAGVLLSQLKCPTAANNSSCADEELYTGWDEALNEQGQAYWDFGTSEQLPALRVAGKLIRDTDLDAVPDHLDEFPNNKAASADTDKDGAIDYWPLNCDKTCREGSGLVLDQFPLDPSASLDTDLDGFPDAWNIACNGACQAASGLVLDVFLNDFDNDGITDNLDPDDNNDGIVDADPDSDGYIDIATLEELDAIRFDLAGSGQKFSAYDAGNDQGCVAILINGRLDRTCLGYELTADLDFDTNGNGTFDEADTYWNDGQGWQPIGDISNRFTADFKGNGYTIKGLMINRPNDDYQGLFGRTYKNRISGLHLSHFSITADTRLGALVGHAERTLISEVALYGRIQGIQGVGGIAGYLVLGSVCSGCAVSGLIKGEDYVGGIAGIGSGQGRVENSMSLARVVADSNLPRIGGIVGYNPELITNTLVIGPQEHSGAVLSGLFGTARQSYWAVDGTGKTHSGVGSSPDLAGVMLNQLKCPTASDNTTCAGVELYKGWGSALNEQGEAYWDFGTAEQLPALRVAGKLIRDNDDDGAIDEYDDFPTQYEISIDSDSDGYADQFNDRCNEACQLNSAIVIDQFPNNADEWIDSDNDGIGNNADTDDDSDGVLDGADAFPLNASESIDSDNDGFGNNEDVDDDNDMITDVWEEAYGFDPLDPNDALLDADNDSASNLDEFESGTDPRDADSVPAWLKGGGAWKYYLYKKAAEGATLQ